MPPSCVALIVAGGSSSRFGGSIPKQYQPLGGMALIRRTVLAFQGHPGVQAVHVVINPAHRALYDVALAGLDVPPPIAGGAERQDSVLCGLEALALRPEGAPARVLIHDAARPLIDAATISAVIKALDEVPAALAAKPLVDTLKRASAGATTVAGTVDRAGLWQAHTPQGFHFPAILAAHRAAAGQALTDDAAVAERGGIPVMLVLSNADNMKITNPDDLGRAARLLGQSFGDVRTGLGFDVHRLIPGEGTIRLGGIDVPHTHGLEGHSDADVILHAVVDALLGALGAGDIGTYFPPSDPQWRGCDSARFVSHAVSLVHQRGGIIAHVDVTLIGEQPRLSPHRIQMVERLAALLEITPDRVNVKATTTERLGFTGRSEGLAAQAVATLRFQET